MYLNLEMNLNSAKNLNSRKVYLNLRKRLINSETNFLKYRQFFAEFKFIYELKCISEFKVKQCNLFIFIL